MPKGKPGRLRDKAWLGQWFGGIFCAIGVGFEAGMVVTFGGPAEAGAFFIALGGLTWGLFTKLRGGK